MFAFEYVCGGPAGGGCLPLGVYKNNSLLESYDSYVTNLVRQATKAITNQILHLALNCIRFYFKCLRQETHETLVMYYSECKAQHRLYTIFRNWYFSWYASKLRLLIISEMKMSDGVSASSFLPATGNSLPIKESVLTDSSSMIVMIIIWTLDEICILSCLRIEDELAVVERILP